MRFAGAAAGPELLNPLIPPGAGNFFLKSKKSATRRSVGLWAVDILTQLGLSQLNHTALTGFKSFGYWEFGMPKRSLNKLLFSDKSSSQSIRRAFFLMRQVSSFDS